MSSIRFIFGLDNLPDRLARWDEIFWMEEHFNGNRDLRKIETSV